MEPHFQAHIYTAVSSPSYQKPYGTFLQGTVFTLPPCNQHENALYWRYSKTSQATGLSSIPKGFLAFTLSGTWYYFRVQKALTLLVMSGYSNDEPKE